MSTDWRWATPSRVFLNFLLAVIAGICIGRYQQFPTILVAWFFGVWLTILWSKQEAWLMNVSASLAGLSGGLLLWQLTGGEAWLHSSLLSTLSSIFIGWRDNVVEQISRSLPEPHGSLLSGIIFGSGVGLNKTVINDFRLVGLSHVVAVSGYNLTILTANVRSLFRPLIGKRAAWLSLGVIVLFVLMTGAPSSIIRAGVMASLVLWADLLGRPVRSINILVFAAAVMAVFEPKILFNVGFQLSIAATYGLIRLSPIIDTALTRAVPLTWLRQILAETLGATIVTAPIIVAVFGKFAVVSPLSNVLVLPLIPLLEGLGIIGCFAALIVPTVGHFLLFITWPILAWILFITHRLASWPFASVETNISVAVVVTLALVIVTAIETLRYYQHETSHEPVPAR